LDTSNSVISSNLPSNLANQIAAYSPIGRQPVGQEAAYDRNTTIKPVEQLSSSSRTQIPNRNASPPEEQSPAPLIENGVEQERSAANREPQTREESIRQKQQLEQEQAEIKQLAARDREVRAHEQAHSSIGGQYAGAAQYQYERGPDGVRYAVSGEVPIDVSREATPEATILKAEIVKRAALAPAEPSPQDRRVAAEATRMAAEARQELRVQQSQATEAQREVATEDSAPVEPVSVQGEQIADDAGDRNRRDEANRDFVRAADSIISSRLSQGIANTSLSSNEPGSILDQIV